MGNLADVVGVEGVGQDDPQQVQDQEPGQDAEGGQQAGGGEVDGQGGGGVEAQEVEKEGEDPAFGGYHGHKDDSIEVTAWVR